MARHFVSKKDVKALKESLSNLGITLPDSNIEVDERKGEKCFFVGGKPYVYVSDRTIPTLFLLNEVKPDKMNVTVDDGAVPHIINGANVFAQGITDMDSDIVADSMVFIRNNRDQYIGVGISRKSAEEILANRKGEAITLIHFPGDRIMKTFF